MKTDHVPIKTALCSVTDKSGLGDLARCLASLGCRIISSGGTAGFLRQLDIPVESVSQRTGFPEILDGRVKTLHPKVHGALLGIRGNAHHEEQMKEHGIEPIDLVVVNLYPFVQTVARKERTVEDAIENIDIGGPSMIRSAAKNFEAVAVVTDPGDYAEIIQELQKNQGALCLATRLRLAQKAFALTSEYDHHVQEFMTRLQAMQGAVTETSVAAFPLLQFHLRLQRVWSLRYGENPHQRAAFYRDMDCAMHGLARAHILQGKELSYNNLMDLDAAMGLAGEFREPAAVIIKHNNPCGTAVGENILSAYRKAHDADPVSAFGSVIALNREVDEACAQAVASGFVEALIATSFTSEALEVFQSKKSMRILELSDFADRGSCWRSVSGGLLVQDADSSMEERNHCKVVSRRQPTEEEWKDLFFAWKVVKHVKSNAIVFARNGVTSGVGAGQMSRVDSAEIAVRKAGARAQGAVLASDAFFPFRDGLDVAARAGITAAIEPGGSMRDEEVIAAADEHGIALVFTGVRHFRH